MRRETNSDTGYGVRVGCGVGRGCKREEAGEMGEIGGEREGCERGWFRREIVEVDRVDGRVGGRGRRGEGKGEKHWKKNCYRE